MSAVNVVTTEENTISPEKSLIRLPFFSISSFRGFVEDPKVWGHDSDVFWDDVKIHVREDNGIVTYSTDANEIATNSNVFDINENRTLANHSDTASVYIESGSVYAVSPEAITKYVKNVLTDVHFKYNGYTWQKSLDDIIRAWDANDPRDLRI